MQKEVKSTDKAPAAIGPYSQAVKAGNLLFCSGMLPVDPASGEIVAGDVTAQAEQVLTNIGELLTAVGSGLEQVVKTTVFIKNMDDFAAVNAVYQKYFTDKFPARSCVEVARLPKDVLVEIECIALTD